MKKYCNVWKLKEVQPITIQINNVGHRKKLFWLDKDTCWLAALEGNTGDQKYKQYKKKCGFFGGF